MYILVQIARNGYGQTGKPQGVRRLPVVFDKRRVFRR
jgi:hypothetical protein